MASGPLSPIVPPQRPQQPQSTQWSNKSVAILIVSCCAIVMAFGLIYTTLTKPKPQPQSSDDGIRAEETPATRRTEPTSKSNPIQAPPKTPNDEIRERLAKLANYAAPDAFRSIGPSDANDRENLEAVLFGIWLLDRGGWEDVQPAADEKTSFGLVMKDADKERGKRLCVSGTIVQIRVDSGSDLGTETFGILMGRDLNAYRFIAVNDTGDLVADSPARFCGFVAGKTAYANTQGGEAQGVYMVGMFDLPSNRALKHKPAKF